MALTRRRLRFTLFRLAAVLGSIAAALLIAEGAIRLCPDLLSERLRHAAFSRYDTLPGGIFRYEGLTRSRIMRADFRSRAFSHGYFWIHETDDLGYRNPRGLAGHDVLLLGDSLIYGHGVGGDETVTHFLRSEHGIAAYDMSAQGDCVYQHYLALRLHLERLHPRTVLLFVYVNDVHDLEVLGRTAGGPEYPEVRGFDYGEIRRRIARLNDFRDPLPARLAFSSALFRMVAKTRGWRPARPPESTTPREWRPRRPTSTARPTGTFAVVLDESRFAPIEIYYQTVLRDLAERAKRLGTRLVVIHLVPPIDQILPARDEAQGKLQASLRRICDRLHIDEIDTGGLFAGHTGWILPGDGHLNPDGHRALAGFLAREVLDTE